MHEAFVPPAEEHRHEGHRLLPIDQKLTLEQIAKHCQMEADAGRRVHILEVKKLDKDGNQVSRSLTKNSRTNAGAAAVAGLLGSASVAPFNYIALSTATLTPAAGDTTLTSETVVSGLARKTSTYGGYIAPASLNASCTYTLSATFTNSGGSTVTILSCGCFNAASAGTLLAEANLANSEVLNVGESLSFVWTFTA